MKQEYPIQFANTIEASVAQRKLEVVLSRAKNVLQLQFMLSI